MGLIDTQEAFTNQELADIAAAANERGVTIWEIIHDAVTNDLAR
jgi:hypothetical protein